MNKLITEKRTGASSTIKTKKKQHCKSVNLYHPESYKTLNWLKNKNLKVRKQKVYTEA